MPVERVSEAEESRFQRRYLRSGFKSKVERQVDLRLQRIEAVSKRPRTRSILLEASYLNHYDACIEALNDGTILQPNPEILEYYEVSVKKGDKHD